MAGETDQLLDVVRAAAAHALETFSPYVDPEPHERGTGNVHLLAADVALGIFVPSTPVTAVTAAAALTAAQRAVALAVDVTSPSRMGREQLWEVWEGSPPFAFSRVALALEEAAVHSLWLRLRVIGTAALWEAQLNPVQFSAALAALLSMALTGGSARLDLERVPSEPRCEVLVQGMDNPELRLQARHLLQLPDDCTITITLQSDKAAVSGVVTP